MDVAQGKVDPQRARDVALVDVYRARDDVEPLADVVGEASPLRGKTGPVERGQPLQSAKRRRKGTRTLPMLNASIE